MDNISGLLKAFVIIGGVVLLLGSALLVALLVLRGNEERGLRAVVSAPFELALPAGSRIEQVSMDGERLVLLAIDGAGRQFVAVVDPRTGERLSLIHIRPAE